MTDDDATRDVEPAAESDTGDDREFDPASAVLDDLRDFRPEAPVAFVLGGGGVRGAYQVGMIQALLESGIVPDIIVGTSIGAVNGAVLALDPTQGAVDRLTAAWSSPEANAVYGESLFRQVGRFIRSRTHMVSPEPLQRLLETQVPPGTSFEDLPVPMRVVAASIERAAEQWFSSGPLIPAVMASAAVPGVLPPVLIDGEHYVDGGLVNTVPIEAAVRAGAKTVYVMQIGHLEVPLTAPRRPQDTARIAFEIARRHRYSRDLVLMPEQVTLHILPTGGKIAGDEKLLAYKRVDTAHRRIEGAYAATKDYLTALAAGDVLQTRTTHAELQAIESELGAGDEATRPDLP